MENKRIKAVIRKIREKGYSITPQRVEIIKAVKEDKTHPSAADIYNSVKMVYPMISLNTVYKNLALLSELREVREIKTRQDAIRFDGDIHPHGHIICEGCGKIEDLMINEEDIKGLLKSKEKGIGTFGVINGLSVELHGLCSNCSAPPSFK